ncbi:MAG: recombinase family protein [Boseongicola sp.]|nr:recombinase family protein [Boseongicola sp.]
MVGDASVSKANGSPAFGFPRSAQIEAEATGGQHHSDQASGNKDGRYGLTACLRALRHDDVLIVWQLSRLGRSLRHLVRTAPGHCTRCASLTVLKGRNAQIDTATSAGRPSFDFFAALSLNLKAS